MTTAVAPIAKLKGTFARPGVSKNRRWYKPEHIAAAVTEAQAALDSGDSPMVMLTHHGARDSLTGDVTKTAARITRVGLDAQGNGTFEAEVLGTQAGQEIDALTKIGALKGVSMASTWKGIPRRVSGPDGLPCETADGFTLKGIDFTHNPGIQGAEAEPTESAPGDLLYESIEEDDVTVEAIEEATKEPYGDVTYADPGYQGDKKARYPLSSAKKVRAAWAYINVAKNAEPYTAAQLRRIKGKIKKAAKGHDIDINEELRLLGNEILEAYASVCLDNGPGTVSISAYVDDPAQLAAVGRSVAVAALAGLYQLDPDCDGDIDLAISEDDDDSMDADPLACPACGAECAAGSNYCPSCGQPVAPGESAPDPETEGDMPNETNNEGAATESTLTITKDELDAQIAESVKMALESAGVKPAEVESPELAAARKLIAEADAGKPAHEEAPAAAVTESAGLDADTVKAMITEAVSSAVKTTTETVLDVARREIQEAGPRRRGLVLEQAPEEIYGDRDLSKLSTSELYNLTDEVTMPLIASR